jgi:hypothetical protein
VKSKNQNPRRFLKKLKRRMKMKSNKVLAFLMLLAMIVPLLAGCGGAATTAAPEAPAAPAEPTKAPEAPAAPEAITAPESAAPAIAHKVTVAIGADPSNLGPFVGMSMGRISVLSTSMSTCSFRLERN